MKLIQSPRLYAMIHHWSFWLVLITFIGIFLRMVPSLMNAAWGVDFGIYYGLTNSFIASKDIFTTYTGWGNSYQYFPVLYTITGIAHWITGIETVSLMSKIAPIFGGLTVPILYFIANEILKNKKVALLSAALLSVATFHVYQTSHAAPMTIGHFFMMVSLLFFIKALSKKQFFIPLIGSTALLIMSHHFTMYFYLITITFIIFANIFSKQKREQNNNLAFLYLLGASGAAFSYWAFIATPVFYQFMPTKTSLHPLYLIGMFYVFIFIGFFFLSHIKDRSRDQPVLQPISSKVYYKNIITYLALLISTSVLAAFYGIPGMTVKLTPLAVLFSIPMLLLVSFSFVGLKLLKSMEQGNILFGWVFGILLSFGYSLMNPSFFPDRHLEYLIVPLCIGGAVATYAMYSETQSSNIKHFVQPILQPHYTHHRKRVAIISIISMMCIANMMAAYASVDVLHIIDERVTDPCMNSIDWLKGNITEGVVASDHRLSNIIWAAGFNITFSETNTTWTGENLSASIDEINRLNISYIVIDDIMRENVVFIGNAISFYMTNESYEKFSKEPFELLYRNATYTDDGEENHWVEIYQYHRTELIDSKNLSQNDPLMH